MSRSGGHLYEFGQFRLEPAEQLLLREQRPVALTPKNFDFLVYLVENHGRLVTKQQIMQAVLPDSYVEEANLTVSISGLRKVLGETEEGRQYIETVPKKGYRFTAAVKSVAIPTREAQEQSDTSGTKRAESLFLNASGRDHAGEAAAPILDAAALKPTRGGVMIVGLVVLIGLLGGFAY